MQINDTNTPCKIQRREHSMLKLEQFKDELEDDNTSEALKCLEEAILYYEKPEIYEEVDVELVHFLMRLTENLSLEQKKKIGLYIKNLNHENKSIDSFNWLLDFIELLLGSCTSAEDPFNILSLKALIKKYPNIMELRLALAIAKANNACSTRNKADFQDSLKIYEELGCFFQKRLRLSDRWRRHFPPDPLENFFTGRINTTLNYAIYLTLLGDYQNSIEILNNTLKSDWIKKAYQKDVDKLESELRRIMSSEISKEKTPIFQYTTTNIGTQLTNNINNSPFTHVEQGNKAIFTSTVNGDSVTSIQSKPLEENDRKKIIELIQKPEVLMALSPEQREELEKNLYSLKKEKKPSKSGKILNILYQNFIRLNKSGALTSIINLIKEFLFPR